MFLSLDPKVSNEVSLSEEVFLTQGLDRLEQQCPSSLHVVACKVPSEQIMRRDHSQQS